MDYELLSLNVYHLTEYLVHASGSAYCRRRDDNYCIDSCHVSNLVTNQIAGQYISSQSDLRTVYFEPIRLQDLGWVPIKYTDHIQVRATYRL